MFRRFGLCFPVLSGLSCFCVLAACGRFFFWMSKRKKKHIFFIFGLRLGFSHMCWALFFGSVRFVFRVSILCVFSFCFQKKIIVFCISISIWFFQNVGLHVLACAFLFYQACRFCFGIFFFFKTEEAKCFFQHFDFDPVFFPL